LAVVVTAKGKEILAARLIGSTPTQTEPKFIGWGTQNGLALTAAATDVAPFAESAESRTTGTASQVTTTTTNDTYQLVGTITATGTRAINEVIIADSATKPAAAAVAAGGVVGSAVSTTLNTAATFTPGNSNYIQIRTEVMLVTAGSGSTALTVTRGQNGSSAISTIAAADIVQPGNPPGQTGITGGSLLLHADHGVNNLNSGDSIAYTLKVQNT
jgi:hypothetical protein